MERERLLLAIGGLLHDIGKVLQRAGFKENNYQEFNYQHAKLSYNFVEKELKHKLSSEDYKKIITSTYHHKPETLGDIHPYIYRFADYFASSERSLRTLEEKVKLLMNVFSVVELDGEHKNVEWTHYYELKPLEVDFETPEGYKLVYPKDYQEIKARIDIGEKEKIEKEITDKYKNLLCGFKKGLDSIDFSDLERAFERLYHIFYKYFWCVPASTWDQERKDSHYPDISLFDHSRVVACLSASFWTDYNIKVIESLMGRGSDFKTAGENLKLVLIDGDITGIQNFLYNLSGYKGSAKRLRGKSLFLAILPELVGRYLLGELGYPRANLLYAGGGKFWALVGYEEGMDQKLAKIEQNVEEALIRKYNGALGFVLTHHEFNANMLRIQEESGAYASNFREVVKSLYEKVEEKKKRKFYRVIERFEELANQDWQKPEGKVICPSCRSVLIKEGYDKEGNQLVCHACKEFETLGAKSVKADYLLLTKDPEEADLWIEPIGGIAFLKDKKHNTEGFLYAINNTKNIEDVDGFRFLARTVPTDEENNVLDLESLVEDAESGYELLGFARADVDNLGYIFACGLKKDYSISRVATLSRNLELFFSGVVNAIIRERFQKSIYTVYSGGDDLFLIGYWEDSLSAMCAIRQEFKLYTEGEASSRGRFDLSAGIYLAGPKYPVRLGAEGAGKEEDKAKEKKPAVAVLSEVLTWDQLEEALDKLGEKNYEKLNRSFVYKIYNLLKQHSKRGVLDMRFYPLLYYFTYRNLEESKAKEFIKLILDEDYQIDLEQARFMLKYILMKTRQKGSNKAVNKNTGG
ncbi:type III-A CRISPR-associated protein Cas10/Csm1 [Hydrogenobacter hydrogenophilus]|uniref:CRISPR-associated protein Cas10/Csm1, subtype III-A/MTUBE n=1 Tax=Hydrogenobacter hydrogenophilus TaxID=35835 RepID=A0A285NX12_9AQUI|nr:type III-A CRISPR-associated protein Cas10/Csm1 [Hydrogenobacter hydrogenophilus]SNZ14020.1 CRISPR-associated protein Cas10/Csm1, subtype III-A/MTUBE [Hydrogenobacter hydrogenophilus]